MTKSLPPVILLQFAPYWADSRASGRQWKRQDQSAGAGPFGNHDGPRPLL